MFCQTEYHDFLENFLFALGFMVDSLTMIT